MTVAGPIIVAEAGVNHCGDIGRAREMIAAAAEAGADYVKFQAFRTEEVVAALATTAPYQKANTGLESQSDLLRQLELTCAELTELAETCRGTGIKFMCTPFDAGTATFLAELGVDRLKVPSGELTNLPYLARLAALRLPVLLSTGMSTLEEVRQALDVLRAGGAGEITVLHCTSLYPAPVETINLRAMLTMHEELGVPVGYSDHSLGIHVPIAAAALGAAAIEKHFTLDRSLPGPDHAASLEPDELAEMVRCVRQVALALGDGVKAPAAGEAETARLVRRSWHAVRELAVGAMIGPDDIALRRPADGLEPGADPTGRRLARSIAAEAPIRADDLRPDGAE